MRCHEVQNVRNGRVDGTVKAVKMTGKPVTKGKYDDVYT